MNESVWENQRDSVSIWEIKTELNHVTQYTQ
jgi:hypothetical protein